MIGIAAGMALRGMKPFCYTIATFALYRPFEMIRVDLCYQNLPVTIVGMGTGTVYSTLGGTHLTQEDVSVARLFQTCKLLLLVIQMKWKMLLNIVVISQRILFI